MTVDTTAWTTSRTRSEGDTPGAAGVPAGVPADLASGAHTSVRPVPEPTDVAAVLAHHMSALQDLLGVCSAQQALLERQGELLAEQSQLVEDARRELAALRAGTAPGVGSGLASGTGGRDDASTAGD